MGIGARSAYSNQLPRLSAKVPQLDMLDRALFQGALEPPDQGLVTLRF
jgi:hypothetical protein